MASMNGHYDVVQALVPAFVTDINTQNNVGKLSLGRGGGVLLMKVVKISISM